MEWFKDLNPVIQALLATLFTWGLTALGSALVFFFKNVSKKILNSMLAFAAGVMIAASFWSLLNPAIEMAESLGKTPWVMVSAGFMSGGLFLLLVDKFLPHLHLGFERDESEGVKTSWQRSVLLVLAITLHNIPEGLAVGVAFGAAVAGLPSATLAGAVALAIGIGIQNFPEGAAVSLPLRREGFSPLKSFMYGQASGIVEPIAGVIGAFAVISMRQILPFALSFAAGAMIFVVVEELIPEAQHDGETDISTMAAMIGFTVMMILDVALG
ncbi:ZIP family metal transporter [Clostridium polynesiense]|uniref:ZIP family metal transporter n=1 Tax=Clostridium polynesiense TaxID=1325933 RepID=UPI00058CC0D5|nr:ZIP family metal transporter [Clostridium polynesiense]